MHLTMLMKLRVLRKCKLRFVSIIVQHDMYRYKEGKVARGFSYRYLQGNKISEIPQNLFEEVQNVEIM